MTYTTLTAALVFSTLILALVFALYNKHKTEQRLENPNSTKSTLAKDKDSEGKPADV